MYLYELQEKAVGIYGFFIVLCEYHKNARFRIFGVWACSTTKEGMLSSRYRVVLRSCNSVVMVHGTEEGKDAQKETSMVSGRDISRNEQG